MKPNFPLPKPGERVFSMSAIKTYRRCPKSFWFAYINKINRLTLPDVVERGTSFHEIAEAFARAYQTYQNTGTLVAPDALHNDITGMGKVFLAWWQTRGEREFAQMREIYFVDEPLYLQITSADENPVWFRFSPDLVYRDEHDWIVIRDYKTFAKAPSNIDNSLNFQFKSYIAAIMRLFFTSKVRFETCYIRQELNHTGKKSHIAWGPEESYIYDLLVIGPTEANDQLLYLGVTMHEIMDKMEWENPYAWNHVDQAGSQPFSCNTCFYRTVCKAEAEIGPAAFLRGEIDLAAIDCECAVNEHNRLTVPSNVIADNAR